MKISKKIILVILIIINIFVFYKLNNNQFNFKHLFKPACHIKTIKDLEYCYSNNRNVVLDNKQIYNTGYRYIDNNHIFIDIDISNKSLISIINKKNINDKKIYGHLEKSNNIIFNEVIKNIKKDYQEKMQMKNIDDKFIPLILNGYEYKNNHIINLVYVVLFVASIIFITIIGIKIIKEEKHEK